MKADLRLYFVTDPHLCQRHGLVETVMLAVAGGATLVQLRDPHAKGRALLDMARALVAALAPLNIPLIVNDRVDIAHASGAQGVHIGQDDISVEAARAILGRDAIVGLSITEPSQIASAPLDLIDHFGVGPVFGPGVKIDAKPAMGLAGLRACASRARKPIVAIGAISADNAAACIEAGADGVAVVSAIAGKPDPRVAASELRGIVDAAFAKRSAA